jgi:predicted  nucleic acid-binding Zn-ribbon protein
MTATVMIPTVLREIHRLRRHHRDLLTEIERLPRLLKAHQAKIAKQEQAFKQAQDDLKHLKVSAHDKEVNLKATNQQLAKYEKQLNDMKTPKEVEAKEKEIATSKKSIAELEEQILLGLAEIDESSAKIPLLDKALKDARAELSVFEKDSKERQQRLTAEVKLTEEQLKKQEVHLPAAIRGTYDRLVKAYGPDALAVVNKSSCGHCHTSVTAQNVNEMNQGRYVSCNSCGRMLYLSAQHSSLEAEA